jgi:RimJ/RimL family protein N-acetyltransferase
MPWTPVETERLLLRAFRRLDAIAFSLYRSDPAVARYQGWDAPYSLERALQFVEEIARAEPGIPDEWYQVAVVLRANGILIGDCAFKLIDQSRQAEVGLTIASGYQAQAYGSEAMEALLRYLFSELEVHRVCANCDVQNPAAYRTLERLGFRREAHFIENLWFKGAWASEYWYGLLRGEWLASRGSSPNP